MELEIAVVIPTNGRETRLAFALDALAAQTVGKDRFEVVVVRDVAQPGPFTSAPDGVNVRFLTVAASKGPTDKRNAGWRSTRAPIIAFTDDDCRPAPEWLERIRATVTPAVFMQGRTVPDPDETHLLRGLARSQTVVGPSPWFPGCNLAFHRSLLDRVDGFDESFTFGGEDTDLGLRAQQSGAECVYRPDALVWHAVFSRTLPAALRESVAWPTFPLVISRHPDLRRSLYASAFRNKSHAMFCVAAAGALTFRSRRFLAALAIAPYLGHHIIGGSAEIGRNPRIVARALMGLPSRAIVDAVEVAATITSGLAHRVPVA